MSKTLTANMPSYHKRGIINAQVTPGIYRCYYFTIISRLICYTSKNNIFREMVRLTEWNPALYDNKHKFVSNFGESLVSLLNPQAGESILDVGCGTGDLANDISRSGAIVTGMDASQSMIGVAQDKYPSINFSVQTGEEFSFETKFNAVFSNAAIHWMKGHRKVVQNCYDALLPGGRFVVELGGEKNIQSIVDAIELASKRLDIPYDSNKFPWVFPTQKEMTDHLTHAGFEIIKMEHFERPTPLDGEDGIRNWLEMFSNNMFADLTEVEIAGIHSECERILRPQIYQDNQWVVDYRRLRFVARKA